MTEVDTKPTFAGIYGIPDAALYLSISPPFANGHKVSTTNLRYWIRTGVPDIPASVYPTRQRFITFLDLVSMRMVAMLRSEGVKLHEIRTAERYLREEFGLQWPFATQSLWTYSHNVFVHFEEYILTASKYGQQAMDFIKGWLREVRIDMGFDGNGLPLFWCPYERISLDPKIQFGEPCIQGTRVSTHTIWSNVIAGDSPELVARLYDLTINDIERAVEWEERLDAVRARTILRN